MTSFWNCVLVEASVTLLAAVASAQGKKGAGNETKRNVMPRVLSFRFSFDLGSRGCKQSVNRAGQSYRIGGPDPTRS